MRQVADAARLEPVKWIAMKHEADCWIAACAMAAGTSYETAEESFGSGADYSAAVLGEKDEADDRRIARMFLFLQQFAFFADHGYYPLLIPEVNPVLKHGRRYLLSAKSYDPQRSWMAHTIVVDEAGRVLDPDPKYDPNSQNYAIENYSDLAGWEIVKFDWL
jgi:hypothetical protein